MRAVVIREVDRPLTIEHIEIASPGSFADEKRLQGSNMGSNRFRGDMPRYAQMYLDGRPNLDDMVTARLSLSDVNEGFDRMRTGRVARNMIVFEGRP